MKNLVAYFIGRPLVVNVLMFGALFLALGFWSKIGKEEMPDITLNWMRVSISYPGASAEDVELFIVRPIEEKIKGVFGIEELSSSAAFGSASFRLTFIPGVPLQEKVQEVKDAVESVELPRETREPVYGQYRSNERAIINISLYLKGVEILNTEQRQVLQEYALAFKNRLISLPEISGVETSGYLRPELQIQVDPAKLLKHEIPFNQVVEQIQSQNIRTPLGSLRDRRESEMTLLSELDNVDSLKNVLLANTFEGVPFKLNQVAVVREGFERATSLQKIQGHESVTFNVLKGMNTDILSAQKAVVEFIDELKRTDPNSPVGYILVDDESYDIRNRMSLILTNGLTGFVLILLILFMFLDFRSGLWVAMGIPFSMAFTLVVCVLMGESVNNMTLAGIIIVLGIVVDDAIIVAENIERRKDPIEGTMEMISPIIASILTTIVAFVPLLFFSGRFGLLIAVIPTIVSLMLIASLIESFFILPAHMAHPLPGSQTLKKWFPGEGVSRAREKFVKSCEDFYHLVLTMTLKIRPVMAMVFLGILVSAGWIWQNHLSYVMFPREEGNTFNLRVLGPDDTSRVEMAKLIRPLEDIFLNDDRELITSVFSRIAQSRRGGEVRENEASIRVEILPPSERKESLSELIAGFEAQTKGMDQFQEIRFLRDRFGSDSGSPLVIRVQENNEKRREAVLNLLAQELGKIDLLANVELEKPVTRPEYRLHLKEQTTAQLSVSFSQLATTLRAFIEGTILYVLNTGDEEIDVRVSSEDSSKRTIEDVLQLHIANQSQYLVPVSQLVEVVPGFKPSTIQRINFKRATNIYADLVPDSGYTPLEMAERLEREVFPKVLQGNPSTVLSFIGEVQDSRESQDDFSFALILVLALIYVLLVFLFDSLSTPFLIAAIIPFGAAGVILALAAHGMWQYGFFAVVGALGMTGVVINDSIVMLNKFEKSLETSGEALKKNTLLKNIAELSKTRFRAVLVTTLTTVAGLMPTAYGVGGYDSMLAEMMLAMAWGLFFGMFITLFLVPLIYSYYVQARHFFKAIL